MTRRAFVLGHGQIGRATAERLVEAGWQVTVASRTNERAASDGGPFCVALDRNRTDDLVAAIGDGFDAVIDTIAFDETHAGQWRTLSGRIGKLVIVSSMSVYCDERGRTLDEAQSNGYPRFACPISESNARIPPGPETYSTRKVALEDAVIELSLPTAILRAGAVYGIGSKGPREWWFVQRVLAGMKEIPIAWGAASRFHPVATENLAELIRVVLDNADSQVLNAVDDECPTVAQLGASILAAMDSTARIVPIDGPPADISQASPWSIPLPIIADGAAGKSLGYRQVTRYADAMPVLCADLVERAAQSGWRRAFPELALYPEGMFLND